jgi:cytochrome c peroxidase
MRSRTLLSVPAGLLLAAALLLGLPLHPHSERAGAASSPHDWSEAEMRAMEALWLGNLPPLPDDPSNAHDTDPRAAAWGRTVFHDVRFSANGQVSCATCHPKDKSFQDGLPRGRGVGIADRRTMPLIAVAYNDWFFWDGRKDSAWSQALAPIENPVEHGISRSVTYKLVRDHYREKYEALFGPFPPIEAELPDLARPTDEKTKANELWMSLDQPVRDTVNQVFANTGKAVAAFVRTILPGPSRFDRYVAALRDGDDAKAAELFNAAEARGLRLFIGEAGCTNCHTGPRLTNDAFHDTGVNELPGSEYDRGRAGGIPQVLHDPFNCLGDYSDAGKGDCLEVRFMDKDTSKYTQAFKTPSLRNVSVRPPYMHAGQLETIAEVLEFYRDEAETNPELDHADLSDRDLADLEAFLATLTGPLAVDESLIADDF